MGTQKGKLFELAEMFHTYQNKKGKDDRDRKKKKFTSLKGEHFDEGKSIILSYNIDMYPEVLYESHQRQASASQLSFVTDEKSEAFYVEPFEAEVVASSAFEDTGASNEPLLDRIVRGSYDDTQATNEPVSGEYTAREMEIKLDKAISPEDDTKSPEKTPLMNDPQTQQENIAKNEDISIKNANSPATGNEGSKPYNVSDEEFAKDIGAILQGKKIYDSEQKKTVSKKESQQPGNRNDPKAQPPPAQDDALAPDKNEHRIFEKIAQSMQYANSYDLGSIALEKRFEQMEAELDKEEVDRFLQTKSTSQEKQSKGADLLDDTKPKNKPASGDILTEKYPAKAPLDETNGGRIISIDELEKGDLILASSSGGVFGQMQGAIGSESIAGIYLGQQQMLAKGEGDVLEEKRLQPELSGRGVLVVLRHGDITSEKASDITTSLAKLRGLDKIQSDRWVKISSPAIGIHADICNSQNSGDKSKCSTWSGKIHLGTMNNDSFICAESVLDAFKNNQVSFVSSAKEHNGTLKYFGHLKNKA